MKLLTVLLAFIAPLVVAEFAEEEGGFLRNLQTTIRVACAPAAVSFTSETVYLSFAKVNQNDPNSHIWVQATQFAANTQAVQLVERAFVDAFNSMNSQNCDPNFFVLTGATIAAQFSRLRPQSFEIQIVASGNCRGCSRTDATIFEVDGVAGGFSGRGRCTCPATPVLQSAPLEASFSAALNATLIGFNNPAIPPLLGVEQRTTMPSMVPSVSPTLADSSSPTISKRPTPAPVTPAPIPGQTGPAGSGSTPFVPTTSMMPSTTTSPTATPGRRTRSLKEEIKDLFGFLKLRGDKKIENEH